MITLSVGCAKLQLFCGHCHMYMNEKTYKEHRRLYCIDGKWLKPDHVQSDSSRSSSPLDQEVESSSLGTQSRDDMDIAYQHDSEESIVDLGKLTIAGAWRDTFNY